jgi:hypothetical protein
MASSGGTSGIDHDDCPSCRFTPLYDTKVYNAKMAVAYPHHYCVTEPAATRQNPVGTTPPPPSRPPVVAVAERSSWYSGLLYCMFLVVVLHVALFGIFVQTRQQSPPLRPSSTSFPTADDNINNSDNNNSNNSSIIDDDFSCNDITISLGSLTEREMTVYCANHPERSCSICGNGLFQSPLECYCYCRFELQRQTGNVTAEFSESTQCCQCSGGGGDNNNNNNNNGSP